MNILSKQGKGGFSLVELMVVIAIIALLTGILVTNLTGPKAKSRDGKRVSDVSQIQLAFAQYFDRCNQFPVVAAGNKVPATTVADGCPSGVTLGTFISKIPTDPTSNAAYDYAVNTGNGTTPVDYVLHATFETQNSASSQSAPAPTGTGWSFSFACDSSLNYCARPN